MGDTASPLDRKHHQGGGERHAAFLTPIILSFLNERLSQNAGVVLVFNSGSRGDLGDYRPVSLATVLGKMVTQR